MMLGAPNRVPESTLSGGSWEASLPLANMQDERRTKVARSVDALATSTIVKGSLSTARSLRQFRFRNHNCSADAQWRVTLGTTAGDDDIYNSGLLNVWQMAFDTDLLEWEEGGWWEGIGDDEFLRSPFDAVHVADQYYTAQYWQIEIIDTSNADGYVQGKAFVSGGLVPARNYSIGASDTWVDPSEIERGRSGSEFATVLPKVRAASFTLDGLSSAEVEYVHDLYRRLGITGDVGYVPDVDDADAQQRYGFVGRMVKLDPIRFAQITRRSAGFELIEKL